MTATTDYKRRTGKESVGAPSEKYDFITEGEDFALGVARYLLVGTAGTATIKRVDGTTITDVPLQVGYNLLVCKQVVSLGTAENVIYCV